MADNKTIFQRLNIFNRARNGNQGTMTTIDAPDRVLFSTNDRDEYERKLTQYRQQKLLAYQYKKASYDNAIDNLAGYTALRLMYRDADLMDGMPEIGAAIECITDEVCNLDSEGQMLHVTSKSRRIKSILEDLFYNRLNIHIMLPMIARATYKYGNEYMLLNLNGTEGVMGWKEIKPYEVERIEEGYSFSHYPTYVNMSSNVFEPNETKFVWAGHNENLPYREWQIAHFRLLYDSFFLPYGTSGLHKARRAWRMWSMMEDAMLIYRLDKSVERRVFKIYVGAIDDADVPAFVQEMANNFKRTPIVDPETGQLDLRKNFPSVDQDYFIPVRDMSAPTPIENLPSAQNPTQMDDINYMQNKVLCAMRVPKSFLNFQDSQGKAQNLSLIDIRFCRMVNRIQQFILLELNKIAIIHLYLLGLGDDIDNFTLSMNNPSAQIEALELEDMTKRIQTAQSALQDPGTGMPILSYHFVLKKILKLSDAEIRDILNEIRLEKAMAAELANTAAIIKKTGLFDSVDRIYGDYDALNGDVQPQQQGEDDMMGGGPGGGLAGGDIGGGSLNMDSLGGAGTEDMGGISGEEGSADMSQASAVDNGTKMESRNRNNSKLYEMGEFTKKYFDMLNEAVENNPEFYDDKFYDDKLDVINESFEAQLKKIDDLVGDDDEDDSSDFDDDFDE